MRYPWMRRLIVSLSNDYGAGMTIGSSGSNSLTMTVKINKYLSALKDVAEVRIKNLTYNEILQIISGRFYNVEIKAGYQNSGFNTLFSGGVLYVSNSLNDVKTNEVIILCASKLVAKFGQAKMSISLNSGINMYAATSFLLKRVGVQNSTIPTDLPRRIAEQYEYNLRDSSIQNYLDYIDNTYADVTVNVDDSSGGTVNLSKATDFENARTIHVNNNSIILTGGYPRLTNTGLDISVLPMVNFMPGDVVKVDNSIIDISVSSQRDVQQTNGIFLDKNGLYKVWEVSYHLENRGPEFSANLICKSKSMIEGDDADERSE